MVTLLLDATHLEVALSSTERALSFRHRNIDIERATITRVQLTDDAWTWLRGARSAGTFVPGVLAMGTWRSIGGDDFAVIRRHRPAVVIDLDGHPEFARVVLTTRHGVALVKALRLDDVDEAADVAELAAEPVPAVKPRRRAPKTAPAT